MKTPAEFTELYRSAPPDTKPSILKQFSASFRDAVVAGSSAEASAALRSMVLPTLDYTSAQSLLRCLRQIPSESRPGPKVRIAVLGSFTTKQLVALLELQLFAAGVNPQIYEGEYGVFRQEILDPQSQLYDFAPQIVLMATTWRDLAHRPDASSDRAEAHRVLETEQAEWSALWHTMHDRLGSQTIQNNFVLPPWRSFTNHELRQHGSLGRYLTMMNLSFADSAPPFVTIHDVDHLSASWGRWSWDDARFVHQAKMPCAPEYLVDYAHSVASVMISQLGMAKKCLVLDLDNTLWGGVIGDDGLGGIKLGQGDPEGEAYLAFQEYVKSHQRRGVILAVCSKNNEDTAREAFVNHPEMVLRLDDISCFVANWTDKATNLRTIAERLNIGLNSLVFVDDNPAERAIARQLVPDVAVPEMPEDVTGYIQALEQHRYFQMLSVGAEDFQRTEYYRADAMRREVQATTGDIDAYLKSLEMKASVVPINDTTLERSAQLIQRSNQFNLTTRRRSAAELISLMSDDAWITRTVSLSDRFGDNGLISVLLAHHSDDALVIDTWLMSCRVLKRGVEHLLLNHLCDVARNRGLKTLRGEYVPSSKNGMVSRHYADLGFTMTDSTETGTTRWELPLTSDLSPMTHHIQEST